MRSKFWLFVLLALAVSACSGNLDSTSQPPVRSSITLSETPAPGPPPSELPPTPYPDTPSPASIHAPLVENPAILHIDMFTELEGWGVTETELVRTNDGGHSWYNVSPSSLQETGYSVDTFFLDPQHAWVQKPGLEHFPNSGTLYSTSDGGLTWTDFPVPFSRGDLNFVDLQNGWVMSNLGAAAGSNAVAVYQTMDGGAGWDKKFTNDPNDPKAANSLPLGGIKSDIVPLDMNTAWVTGTVYAPGQVYLYRTNDGGRSWMPVPLKLPPGTEKFDLGIDDGQMQFVSPSDGYLVLHLSGDSMQTAVYVTHDSGKTWSLTPSLIDGVGVPSFLNAREAVIYSGGKFYVTRDGAQSWVTVSPDVSFGDTFVNMDFVNTMSGWVVTMDASSHRSLYRTMDGGSTWLPVVP